MKWLMILAAVVIFFGGNVCAVCPSMDVTGDCEVNLSDFAVFAGQWLQEGVIPYLDLALPDIAAMEAEMNTSAIDASDGNEFMPGTYFIYKTNAGRFGKFMVENYEPADGHRLTIRWITYNADGSVYTRGKRLTIRGSYLCDLDEGLETTTGADFWWHLQSSTARRLVSQNGAKFKLMHRAIAPAGMVWVYLDEWSVSGFEGYFSKCEITNAQYCQFLNAALASGDITVSGYYVVGANGSNSGEDFAGERYYYLGGPGWTGDGATNGGAARIHWTGSTFTVDSGFENHPVTWISLYGSKAFAGYYGWRIPTEWEWLAAADYDGSYVYGCGTTIHTGLANYSGSTHPNGTTAVAAFGAYGYGMCDMAGNVAEWTDSCFYSDCTGSSNAFRGGGWASDAISCMVSKRSNVIGTLYMYFSVGFRVCR